MSYDGTEWIRWQRGPSFRLPSCYTSSVDSVDIRDTRSLHNDTDQATATLAVGRWPVQHENADLGDVNSGGYAIYNLAFEQVVVELCEPVVLAYAIVNSGNSDIAKAVVQGILKASEDRVVDFIKSQINPPNTVTALLAETISGGLTADVLTDVGGGITGGIAGGLVAAGLAVAIERLLGIVFAKCDGVVASNMIPIRRAVTYKLQYERIRNTRSFLSRRLADCCDQIPGGQCPSVRGHFYMRQRYPLSGHF